MEKIKVQMLEIWSSTHMKIKVQSAMRGMSMREYIDFIANKDKEKLQKGK